MLGLEEFEPCFASWVMYSEVMTVLSDDMPIAITRFR